ncbi:RNA polymerase sigma factor [Parabacteroides johnsonii]|jgi:RNA polymerase sigma-70 factor|uniref:RNA polymerase sigma factor n=1 Tax=Parabacteroides johnsonii TaxID=387661 RepID=UPI00242C670C|nr:RNA polymerase sigma-70 factor [Parabacteroides johnsonii]
MGGSGSCDCFSDEYLLALLGKGDEQAFTIIYQRYHKLLYVVAYKYLKNDCSAKDSVQQIFYRLWESRSVLIVNMNLRNYLYTMLKNHLLNEIRNNYMAMEKNYELAQEKVEYEDDLLDNIEKKEIEEQLYLAINGLPEQKKQVCLYKLRGNLSNLEIANKMGISVPTVKTHYAQAVKMLREHFNKLLFMIYSFWLS